MGLWDEGLDFRLPDRLPPLPQRPATLPRIEAGAVGHRIDLQIARMELVALAKSLDLANATRFVTLLDLAGIDRRTRAPERMVARLASERNSRSTIGRQSRTMPSRNSESIPATRSPSGLRRQGPGL